MCTVDSVEPVEEGMIETLFTCDDEGEARPLVLQSGDYHGSIPWEVNDTLSITRWAYDPGIDPGGPSWTIAVRDLADEELLYAGSIYAAYAYKWDAGESTGGTTIMIQRVD